MAQTPPQGRRHDRQRDSCSNRNPKSPTIVVLFCTQHVCFLTDIRSEVALVHGTSTPVRRSSSASADSCSTSSFRYSKSRLRTSRNEKSRLSKSSRAQTVAGLQKARVASQSRLLDVRAPGFAALPLTRPSGVRGWAGGYQRSPCSNPAYLRWCADTR